MKFRPTNPIQAQTRRLEAIASGLSVKMIIAAEFARSHDYGGRSAFSWKPPVDAAPKRNPVAQPD